MKILLLKISFFKLSFAPKVIGYSKSPCFLFFIKGGAPSKVVLHHMADIHQEQPSIRNLQVVSSNHVHSNHLCEANRCRISKPCFCLSDKRFLMLIIKKMKEINLRMCFYCLKLFWGFENDNILSLKSYTVTKSGISPQQKLGYLRNLRLKLAR